MQIIIDGGSSEERLDRVSTLFPKEVYRVTEVTSDKPSIPVQELRKLVNSLQTTTSQPRLIIIPQAESLTTASQNTLLKSLEEPPIDTSFALLAPNARQLLSTIRSRCQIIHLPKTVTTQDEALLSSLKLIMGQGIGGRIVASSNLGKDREELLGYFQKLLSSLETTIHTTNQKNKLNVLSNISFCAMEAHKNLKANGNVTLVRDNFFLSLPHLK